MMGLEKVAGKVVLFVCVMSSALVFAQSPKEKSFRIDIQVDGLHTAAKLILTVREINQWVEYTAESSNGKFVLTGPLKEPSFAYLVMKYGNEKDLQPRRGNISQVYLSYVPMKINTPDSLGVAKIEGGHLQRELEELTSLVGDWRSPKKTNIEKSNAISGFIKLHPDSFVSLYAVQNFSLDGTFAIEPDRVEPLYELLTPTVRNTLSGQELNKEIKIARQTAIGSVAPDFVQKDTLGNEVSLHSFRGKYVLVDFWASWCKPCRKENPALVKAFHEFKDRNFTIVSVSLDNSRANWVKAINKDGLIWTHTSDLRFWKNEVALQYGVKSVPQNYLLDPDGKIVARNLSGSELGVWLNRNLH